MTLNELEGIINEQIGSGNTVYCRFETLDGVDPDLIRDSIKQIKKSVLSIQAGLTEAKDHRAEALLLTILEAGAAHGFRGYTNKEIKK